MHACTCMYVLFPFLCSFLCSCAGKNMNYNHYTCTRFSQHKHSMERYTTFALQVPPLVFHAGVFMDGSLVLSGGLTGPTGAELRHSSRTLMVLLHGQSEISGEYPTFSFGGQSSIDKYIAVHACFSKIWLPCVYTHMQ